MSVVVVTDASSRLPADLLDKWAIRVVPLHILLDGGDLRDGVDEIPDVVYKHHATTAAATPAELGAAYRAALADSGGDRVVAGHISSALSGTSGVAQRAAAELGSAVRVIDSNSAAMGTGFVALAAARAAAAGARAGGGWGRGEPGGKPHSPLHRGARVGQPAPQWPDRGRQGLARHRARTQAAVAHRRRQTCSGPTGSHGQQGDRGDDRLGLRGRR